MGGTHKMRHIPWPMALKAFLMFGIVLLIGLTMISVITERLCREGSYVCTQDAATEERDASGKLLNYANSLRTLLTK